MAIPSVWTITTTTPTKDAALEIANTTVAERIAAGAWVSGPVTSAWWHLGERGNGEEWKVELRTAAGLRDQLAARIKELHPWDNPELTGNQIEWCPPEYAEWVEKSTGVQE
ncbi:divalent-cation tolerance protein CutA [Nocardia brasiliensis]|uniref:divalent-cation tolerance protein CutA n=1 Tax=Nocardia brasiliensis TaxID=37326 RepID=UPI0033D198A3